MAYSPLCSPEDLALVKVGDVFDGWNGGRGQGSPDFRVKITQISDFRNGKTDNDKESRICVADTVDCEITILKGTFAGETRMLSSVVPSGYHLDLFTPLGGTTSMLLNNNSPGEWNEYHKMIVAKTAPKINDLITLRKAVAATGAAGGGAAAAGGAGSNKRKNRRGTKRVRRTRRRSSRRH